VTLVPAHTEPGGFAEMLTLTGRLGFTVMVIGVDVAGLPEIQEVELEVITHLTTSPFTRVEEV
jgi:hypothetical protein